MHYFPGNRHIGTVLGPFFFRFGTVFFLPDPEKTKKKQFRFYFVAIKNEKKRSKKNEIKTKKSFFVLLSICIYKHM